MTVKGLCGPKGRILVAVLTGILAIAFESFSVLTIMPATANELGGLDFYPWVFTAFVVAMLFAMVLAGRMADRGGVPRPLGTGVSALILGLIAAGFSPSMMWLVAARAIQGFGSGLVDVVLLVLIAKVFDEDERPGVMAAFSFCWVVPSFIGPLISAWIAEQFGWWWVFWAPIPILLVAAGIGTQPLLAFFRVEQAAPPTAQISLWAAGLVSGGVALVQFAGQQVNSDLPPLARLPWPAVVGLAMAGVAALFAGIPWLMPKGFTRLACGLPAVLGLRAFQAGAFFAASSFVPLFLVEEHRFSLVQAGLVVTTASLGWTLAAWIQAQRWLKLSREQFLIVGALSGAVGLAIVAGSAAFHDVPWVWTAIGQLLAGSGMGLTVPSTSLAIFAFSSPTDLGRNSSSLQVADALGNSLTTAAAGMVFVAIRHSGSVRSAFGVLLGVCLIPALLAVFAGFRIGRVPHRHEA